MEALVVLELLAAAQAEAVDTAETEETLRVLPAEAEEAMEGLVEIHLLLVSPVAEAADCLQKEETAHLVAEAEVELLTEKLVLVLHTAAVAAPVASLSFM